MQSQICKKLGGNLSVQKIDNLIEEFIKKRKGEKVAEGRREKKFRGI